MKEVNLTPSVKQMFELVTRKNKELWVAKFNGLFVGSSIKSAWESKEGAIKAFAKVYLITYLKKVGVEAKSITQVEVMDSVRELEAQGLLEFIKIK